MFNFIVYQKIGTGAITYGEYVFKPTDIDTLNEIKELSNKEDYLVGPLDEESATILFQGFQPRSKISYQKSNQIMITKEHARIIQNTSEADARQWIFVEILERTRLKRKCHLIDETIDRLKPIRHLLRNTRPFDINNPKKALKDYRLRIGSTCQKFDKDNGRGKDWINRKTNGEKGMISFYPGCLELAKDYLEYNSKGLLFLKILNDLNQVSSKLPISIADILKSILEIDKN